MIFRFWFLLVFQKVIKQHALFLQKLIQYSVKLLQITDKKPFIFYQILIATLNNKDFASLRLCV